MTRTRILLLSPTLSEGGAERFASTLLCNIDETRFSCQLCLLRDRVTYPLPTQLNVTVLEKYKPYHLPRTILRLRRVIDEHQPDVVVGTMESTNWMLALASIRLRRQPRLVARYVNLPGLPSSHRLQRTFVVPVVRRLLRRATRHVANSSQLATRVDRYLGFAHGTVSSINDPTDIESLVRRGRPKVVSPSDAGHTIVAMGRLVQQKRFDLLLRAMKQVVSDTPARLWIIGDGPLRKRLISLAHELEISESVEFLGFLENPFSRVCQGSLFVMTSDHEGFPNALLEAQGLGIAAVSTDCPNGPSEIIDQEQTGLLVPVGDVNRIAEAITRLLQNDDLRTSMAQKAAVRVRERFNCQRIVAQWEALLQEPTSNDKEERD